MIASPTRRRWLALSGLFVLGSRARGQENKTTRVACVGDSITWGHGIPDREKNCYPARLGELLGAGWDVRNFGVSGATLLRKGDKPYWKEPAFAEAKSFGPGVVIVKLGTNDSKPHHRRFHESDLLADAKALVGEFRSLPSKPRVYLCLPAPAFPENFGISDKMIREAIIPALKKAAEETSTPTIDLHAALAGKKDCFPDKVHPNTEGARIIAETVFQALRPKG